MRPVAAFVVLGAIVGANAAQATDKVGPQFTVIDTNKNSDAVCDDQTTAGLRDDKFVVYFHCSSGGPGDDYGSDSISGALFSRAGTILKRTFSASYNDYWMFDNPAVAGSPSGKFVAVWEDSSSLLGTSPEIGTHLFNAAGVPSSQPFVANTTQVQPQTRPSVAMWPDDSFVVVWASGEHLWRIVGQRFGAQGEYSGPEFIVARGPIEEIGEVKPKVVALSSGRFVVFWDMAFRIYGANGRLMRQVRLATPRKYNVAGLKNGRFVMVWSAYNSGVFGQLYDASGARVGAAFQISPDVIADAEPTIAGLTGGGFVVTWRSNRDTSPISARVYSARANPMGVQFRVDTEFLPGVLDNVDWDWLPDRPSVAALSSGGFVVTYEWWYGIKGQRFKAP